MKTPNELCGETHDLLGTLPEFTDPSMVSFKNGLYFFYEQSEISAHGPKGRIVRVGNHPRSQDGLVKRLRLHYSGKKNSSVFRKFIGGAILRRTNPTHPCLLPGPGEGHWEKQGGHACNKCRPIEAEVSKVLREGFRFRCIGIEDRKIRNAFEMKLIATLSLCGKCKPSNSWLGRAAYSEDVIRSGLWNSDYVFDGSLVLTSTEMKEFGNIVSLTRNSARS